MQTKTSILKSFIITCIGVASFYTAITDSHAQSLQFPSEVALRRYLTLATKYRGRDLRACLGLENSELFEKVFCQKNDLFINPYLLILLQKVGTSECRCSLLDIAETQAEFLLRKKHLTREQKEVISYATHLTAVENNCLQGVGASRKKKEYFSLFEKRTHPIELNDAKQYCKSVRTSCELAGGRERDVPVVQLKQGQTNKDDILQHRMHQTVKACVMDDLVIDSSCLSFSQHTHLKQLKKAIHSVKTEGLDCLSKMNELAGTKLFKHLYQRIPKTEVCCGNNCQDKIFYGLDKAPPRGAVAFTTSSRTFGRIHILDEAFNRTQDDFNGVFYHELLHRIGLPVHPDHQEYAALSKFTWLLPLPSPVDDCPHDLPYVKTTAVGCQLNYAKNGSWIPSDELGLLANSKCLSFHEHLISLNDVGLSAEKTKLGDAYCVLPSQCNDETILKPPFGEIGKDPVYACQAACYHRAKMARNELTLDDLSIAREVCSQKRWSACN